METTLRYETSVNGQEGRNTTGVSISKKGLHGQVKGGVGKENQGK